MEPVFQTMAKNDPRVQLNSDPLTDTPIPNFEDSAGNLWVSGEKGIYLLNEHNGQLTTE
jgi:hypothetical protein